MATNLRLDWCSHEAAKYAVEHWHYSKTMPMPPKVSVGVWEGDRFIGCVIFSRGTNKLLGSPYALEIEEVCELTRVALSSHSNQVSRILSISVKMLRKKERGLRLVVSYADPSAGHHGGIYQAAGWIFSGTTAPKTDYTDAKGRKFLSRQVSKSGVVRQFGRYTRVPSTLGLIPIQMLPKYRYLMPLDDEMRKRIEPLRKPYPKRALAEVETGGVSNIETGGANPTNALMKAKRKEKKVTKPRRVTETEKRNGKQKRA